MTSDRQSLMSAKRVIAGDPSKGSFAYFLDGSTLCMNCSNSIDHGEVVVEDLVTVCLSCAIELHKRHPLTLAQQGNDQLHYFLIYCGQQIEVLKDCQDFVLSLHDQIVERAAPVNLPMMQVIGTVDADGNIIDSDNLDN